MFTGIIQQCGRVLESRDAEHGVTLRIDPGEWSHKPAEGDSISVNGCCLTVHRGAGDGRALQFDVIHETLRCTTLGGLRAGARVHLEHAATPATLLGGHIVQGHVDGVAEVVNISQDGGEYRMRLRVPHDLQQYIVHKGSVALDGVSLTIASVRKDDAFDVALIPATLELTTLGERKPGDRVNVEADYIAKIVLQRVAQILPAPSPQGRGLG